MDAIEKAIRNAFEKGNAEDRAFREKVYRSAFAALDRALQANPGVTVELAIKRRKAMQAKIAEIESEFLPAVPVVAPSIEGDAAAAGRSEAPVPSIDGPAAREASPAEPSSLVEPVDAANADAPPTRVSPAVPKIVAEPVLAGSSRSEAAAPAGVEVAPDGDARRARRRFPLTAFFFGVALLAAVGIGLWWVVQTGAFKTLGLPDEEPAQPPPFSEDAQRKPGDADQTRNWIIIFTPDDPTKVSAPADAKADVMKDDTGAFIRIRSGASGSVSFDVGQGVLEQIAGKHAVFDVIARAQDGKDTQMSIECNFGELGDCGRKRYAVGQEQNEYLFDLTLPDKHPGAGGTIAVNSDFDKQGRSVDIYAIRVSVVE